MIKVVAVKKVKKDNHKEHEKLLKEMVQETLKEKGCISYGAYEDAKDCCKITILEEWESQEHLDCHMASEHFKRLVPQMTKLAEGPSDISILKKLF